jgi:hypothetical protein
VKNVEVIKSTLPCENCGSSVVPRWGVLLRKSTQKEGHNLSTDNSKSFMYIGTEEIFLCASCVASASVKINDETVEELVKSRKVRIVKTPEWKVDKDIQMDKKEIFQP